MKRARIWSVFTAFLLVLAAVLAAPPQSCAQTVSANFNFVGILGDSNNVNSVTIEPIPWPYNNQSAFQLFRRQTFTVGMYPGLTNGSFATNIQTGVVFRLSISDSYGVNYYTNYFPTNVAGGSVNAFNYQGFPFGPYFAFTQAGLTNINLFFGGISNAVGATVANYQPSVFGNIVTVATNFDGFGTALTQANATSNSLFGVVTNTSAGISQSIANSSSNSVYAQATNSAGAIAQSIANSTSNLVYINSTNSAGAIASSVSNLVYMNSTNSAGQIAAAVSNVVYQNGTNSAGLIAQNIANTSSNAVYQLGTNAAGVISAAVALSQANTTSNLLFQVTTNISGNITLSVVNTTSNSIYLNSTNQSGTIAQSIANSTSNLVYINSTNSAGGIVFAVSNIVYQNATNQSGLIAQNISNTTSNSLQQASYNGITTSNLYAGGVPLFGVGTNQIAFTNGTIGLTNSVFWWTNNYLTNFGNLDYITNTGTAGSPSWQLISNGVTLINNSSLAGTWSVVASGQIAAKSVYAPGISADGVAINGVATFTGQVVSPSITAQINSAIGGGPGISATVSTNISQFLIASNNAFYTTFSQVTNVASTYSNGVYQTSTNSGGSIAQNIANTSSNSVYINSTNSAGQIAGAVSNLVYQNATNSAGTIAQSIANSSSNSVYANATNSAGGIAQSIANSTSNSIAVNTANAVTTSNLFFGATTPQASLFVSANAIWFTNGVAGETNGAFYKITGTAVYTNYSTGFSVSNTTSSFVVRNASGVSGNSLSGSSPFGHYGDSGFGQAADAVPGVVEWGNGIVHLGMAPDTNMLAQIATQVAANSNYNTATYAPSNTPIIGGPLTVSSPASQGLIMSNASGSMDIYLSTGSPLDVLQFQVPGFSGGLPQIGTNFVSAPLLIGNGAAITNTIGSPALFQSDLRSTNTFVSPTLATSSSGDVIISSGASNLVADSSVLLSSLSTNGALVNATNNSLTLSSNNATVVSNGVITALAGATNNALTLSSNNATAVSNGVITAIVNATNNALTLSSNNATAVSNGVITVLVSATNNALTLSSNFTASSSNGVYSAGTNAPQYFANALNIGSSQVLTNGATNYFTFSSYTGAAGFSGPAGPAISNSGFAYIPTLGFYSNAFTTAIDANTNTAGSPVWLLSSNGVAIANLAGLSPVGTYNTAGLGGGTNVWGNNLNGNATHFTGIVDATNLLQQPPLAPTVGQYLSYGPSGRNQWITPPYGINVLQAGAKGGGNDDTAALQTILNNAGPIYFPPTNYTCGALFVTNNSQLYGYGATINFKGGVSSNAVFNWQSNVVGVLVAGFTLDGGAYATNNSITTAGSGVTNRMGLNIWLNSIGTSIRDCTIRGFDKAFSYWSTSPSSYGVFQNGKFLQSSCEVYSNYWGIYISTTNSGNSATEYFPVSNMEIHDNTIGIYIGAGNIRVENNDIVDNYCGILVDGTPSNPAHGIISGNAINHNGGAQGNGTGYAILCENVAALKGEDIIGNAFFADGNGIVLSNSAGIKIANNIIEGGVICGANGVSGSSQGPNRVFNNSYGGAWGAQDGVGMFTIDWGAFNGGAVIWDETTNLIHYGNYSFGTKGDADPYTYNPFQTNNASAVILSNTVPATPIVFGEVFQWNSNGVHMFNVVGSNSVNLGWKATNLIW